jgi:serine/threonine-protein kinase
VSELGNGAGEPGGKVGLVGKTLGRYRIAAELGRGGMATVYRAFDPALGRDVAVKVMHGAFAGRGEIERRFRREAQAVAALRHDGIVAVYDFAPGGDGEPAYIVTELCAGPTLRQLLVAAGGRLLPEVAAPIAARVAEALGAAHERGIVHRDVKPDNVMLDARPTGVRVLLADFGIARLVEDDTLTATGSILGSPPYMSPEQARGREVGPPSDVFSLGVTLYQMTTGRMPFAGKDPLAVVAAILAGEFLRPSQVDAHVAPELEAVIMRCLRREPGERYPTGAALAAALRALGAGRAGDADEGALLRRFVDDRAAFEAAIKGPVADEAVARGREHLRRGELTRALSQVSRALAYVPEHRGAEALLAAISARRRWGRVALCAAAAALLVAGGVGLRAARRARAVQQTIPATTVGAAAAPLPLPPPAPGASPQPAPLAEEVEASAKTATKPKRHPVTRRPSPATEARPAEAAAPPPAGAEAPSQPPAPIPPPVTTPAAAAPPAEGMLTLRASHGFCTPSLDDRAGGLRPVYEHVPAGPHRIFCTVPGGARQLAGSYELRAGTRPSLVIVPGPDGKPALARPE